MHEKDVLEQFGSAVAKDKDYSEALCAIEVLIEFIKENQSTTLAGLIAELKPIVKALGNSNMSRTSSVSSACNMFLEYITYSDKLHRNQDFETCKLFLLDRANKFLDMKKDARKKIALIGQKLPLRGKKILIHSYSRVVLHLLKELKDFDVCVYVTESCPDFSGKKMFDELLAEGIDAISILDSAVGYIMEKVDLVLIGSEVVCQSGGALNKIGSYTIALCAQALHKPLYIAVESFKFATIYPLNNRVLPAHYMFKAAREDPKADTTREHPELDYIPPTLITSFVTDLGQFNSQEITRLLIDLHV